MKKNKNMRPDGSRPQKKDDPAQYSLDEILEEARRLRFNELWLQVIERSEQRAAQAP